MKFNHNQGSKYRPDVQTLAPAENLEMFPSFNSNDTSQCGHACASTAGCYFYNLDEDDKCTVVLGVKPGMKGISRPKAPKIVEAGQMNSMCGGDVKFGTAYTKKSSFYCKFQSVETNKNFVEDLQKSLNHGNWKICPFDGYTSSSQVAIVESGLPYWANPDRESNYYWTKIAVFTNLRLNPVAKPRKVSYPIIALS